MNADSAWFIFVILIGISSGINLWFIHKVLKNL